MVDLLRARESAEPTVWILTLQSLALRKVTDTSSENVAMELLLSGLYGAHTVPRQENVQDALADKEYADVVHIVSESLPYEAFLVLVSQHQSTWDTKLKGV